MRGVLASFRDLPVCPPLSISIGVASMHQQAQFFFFFFYVGFGIKLSSSCFSGMDFTDSHLPSFLAVSFWVPLCRCLVQWRRRGSQRWPRFPHLAEEDIVLSLREASSVLLEGGRCCPWRMDLGPSDVSGAKPRCFPVWCLSKLV